MNPDDVVLATEAFCEANSIAVADETMRVVSHVAADDLRLWGVVYHGIEGPNTMCFADKSGVPRDRTMHITASKTRIPKLSTGARHQAISNGKSIARTCWRQSIVDKGLRLLHRKWEH
tara:strand:- start:307 stop:660 length:354 start_codon:yes stop_codon:yes gene_type:complete